MESPNHGDPRKLFVGGLPNNASKETVTECFRQFGDVLGVDIPTHPTGGTRGFCFVCFNDVASAQRALNHAEHIILGKEVEVKQAIPKPSGCDASTSSNKSSWLSRRIFVGGLPQDCTNEELRRHFESFGGVVDAYIVMNSTTSKTRGFGFVTFESYSAAESALVSRSQMLKSKLIEVKPAERKTDNNSTSKLPPNDNGAQKAVGLLQENNVVHGQYYHYGNFDVGGVNSAYVSNMVPYGYYYDQYGASSPNPYNYQNYYYYYPGFLPEQNGQDGPAEEDLPQAPCGEAQVQPPLQSGLESPPVEEVPQTPSVDGELSDGQLQTPQQSEQDGSPPPVEMSPQTPSG